GQWRFLVCELIHPFLPLSSAFAAPPGLSLKSKRPAAGVVAGRMQRCGGRRGAGARRCSECAVSGRTWKEDKAASGVTSSVVQSYTAEAEDLPLARRRLMAATNGGSTSARTLISNRVS